MLLLDFNRFGDKSKVISRNCCKSRAFTLAEVLITLGIIGVVAAMTMPSLINKYQEQVAVSKVKKFYSVMSQALMLSIKDNGPVNEWNITQYDEENKIYSANNMFEQYIIPYLKISKYCGDKSGCLSNVHYRILNGTDGNNYDTMTKYAKAILADGTYIWGRVNDTGICSKDKAGGGKIYVDNVCGVLFIDINGKSAPNTIGKDTFSFFLQPNRIIPIPEDDCHLTSWGWGCSSSIVRDGKLDYLHE